MACEDLRTFNRAMTGTINVRLVIVRGPDGTSAAVDALDMVRMRSITIAATRFLSALASVNDPLPRLTWSVRTSIAQISTPPTSNPNPDPLANTAPAIRQQMFEQREAPWRDPALTGLVGSSGTAGLEALRLDTLGGADNAVTILFTGYEPQWVAYATAREAKVVLGWPLFARPGLPHRTEVSLQSSGAVLAHELCHIFGAPDEYKDSNCSVLRAGACGFGVQDFPNFNCENSGGPKATCLMREASDLLMCPNTRIHIGWV